MNGIACIERIALVLLAVSLFTPSSAFPANTKPIILPAISLLLSDTWLEVTSINPENNENWVPINSVVKLEFSNHIDPETPITAFTIKDSHGNTPDGHWIIFEDTVVFDPVRFKKLETYTITVSTEVKGKGSRLQAEYISHFETGEKFENNQYPLTAEDSPLGPSPLVTIGKRSEYAIVWSRSHKARTTEMIDGASDFTILDPNDDPDTNPEATPTTVTYQNDYGNPNTFKWPVAGQFDDDSWDEVFTATLSTEGDLWVYIRDTKSENSISLEHELQIEFGNPGAPVIEADGLDVVTADFDGDGRDEIFIAVFRFTNDDRVQGTIYCATLDYKPENDTYVLIKGQRLNYSGKRALKIDTGDYNADNRSEAVILSYYIHDYLQSLSYQDSTRPWGSEANVDIVDPMSPQKMISYGNILNLGFTDSLKDCPHPNVSLTLADIDADGADEILVGTTTFPTAKKKIFSYQCTMRDTLYYLDNTTDSYEGDSLVILPRLQGGGLNSPKDISDGYRLPPFIPFGWTNPDCDSRQGMPMDMMVAGRFSGGYRDEVLFNNRIYRFERKDSVYDDTDLVHAYDWPLEVPDRIIDTIPSPRFSSGDLYRPTDLHREYLTRDVAVGDIDGDLKDDVVLIRNSSWASIHDGKIPAEIAILFFDINGDMSFDDHEENISGFFSSTDHLDNHHSPRLALPNVDDDSPVLEFKEMAALKSNPMIVAVLGVPPYLQGIGQHIDDCVTRFATGTETAYSTGSQRQISLGGSVGVTVDLDINALKIKLGKWQTKVAAGAIVSDTEIWTKSWSEDIVHTTSHTENKVIWDNYTYDSFIYTFVDDPENSLSVNVPTGKIRSSNKISYFNAHNGDVIDIDDAIIDSTPGEFNSYLRYSAAVNKLQSPDIKTVLIHPAESYKLSPSGTGPDGWGYEITGMDSEEHGISTYIIVNNEYCFPGIKGIELCAGFDAEREKGTFVTNTYSESTSFAAELGAIPMNYDIYGYSIGMFAYRKTIAADPSIIPEDEIGEWEGEAPGEQQFIVVDYFVYEEPLVNPGKNSLTSSAH